VLHSWSCQATGTPGDIRQSSPSHGHIRTRFSVLPHRNGGPVLYTSPSWPWALCRTTCALGPPCMNGSICSWDVVLRPPAIGKHLYVVLRTSTCQSISLVSKEAKVCPRHAVASTSIGATSYLTWAEASEGWNGGLDPLIPTAIMYNGLPLLFSLVHCIPSQNVPSVVYCTLFQNKGVQVDTDFQTHCIIKYHLVKSATTEKHVCLFSLTIVKMRPSVLNLSPSSAQAALG
jgi:hypothetical protein